MTMGAQCAPRVFSKLIFGLFFVNAIFLVNFWCVIEISTSSKVRGSLRAR